MSTFIGREQDLTALHGYLQNALQGKGKVVFIIGEAGIGKTRLIEEFKAQCLDRLNAEFRAQGKKTPEIRFAEAKCNELAGKGEPYAPFFEIIAQFVTDDKAFGSTKLAEIVREVGSDWFELVPVIGKALSLISKTFFKWRKTDDVRQLADRQVQKDKLVQEFTHILKRMSDEHPLVLFLDDLHWADDSSIALLFHVARHLPEQRILILGAYRPTDIEAARDDKAHPLKDVVYELHRYNLCDTIKLGYLSKAHIQSFLDAYLGQHDLDAAFAAYLFDLTEGNPLFVTEYVKLLQEIGKLAQTDGAWRLQGSITDKDMPIPTSVENVIAKRIERLKEELQKTLKYASVNGEQFNTLVLAKLLNWDELELLEKLEALSRVHQLVKEINLAPGQTPRGAVYQFIHSLVQKSLYATLSAGIKSKLHAKAAEILEEVYHDDLETVAEELVEHHSRGQNHAQAAKYALLAARKANRQAGFQEARAHAQRGLEFLKTAGAKTTDQVMLQLQIELLLELATAEEAIGEAKNSIDHAETAAKLVTMVDDQSFQGEVFHQVGNLLSSNKATSLEYIWKILENSLSLKIKTKDYESIVSVLEKMRDPSGHLGKKEYFIKRCQEIIHLNQQAQLEHLNIPILQLLAQLFYEQGEEKEAYQIIKKGLETVLVSKNPDMLIGLLQQLVLYAVRSNNMSKAAEHYEQAKVTVNMVTDLEIKYDLFYKLGMMAWYLEKYEEAFTYYQHAKKSAHNNGGLQAESKLLADLGYRLRRLCRFDEAIKYGNECLEICKKLGLVRRILESLDVLGNLYRNQGFHSKAENIFQQAITLAKQSGQERAVAWHLIEYQAVLRFMGRFREAIDAITESLRIYQKMKAGQWEVVCLTNLATRHFLLGHISEAISLINQADSINQTIDRELQSKSNSILVAICRSQILIGIGNYKEAHTILESIIEIAVAREVGYNEDLHEHLLNSARLYLAFDIPEKALERLHWVEECLKKYFILEGIAMLKDAYAQVYLAQGEFAKAETSLNEAIALFQQMNSFRRGEADLTLAALRLAQNQPDAALQAAADAHKIFQEIAYYRLGEAILWEAKSHLALRHFPETRASLAAATAIFTRQQQPHHAAEAKLVEGQLLLAESGDKTQALNLFHEANATFEELGLKRLQNEAERLITPP